MSAIVTAVEIWLEARLNFESAWVPRAIDLSDWSRGEMTRGELAYKAFSLKPGQTETIRVASPDSSSADGSGTNDAE